MGTPVSWTVSFEVYGDTASDLEARALRDLAALFEGALPSMTVHIAPTHSGTSVGTWKATVTAQSPAFLVENPA